MQFYVYAAASTEPGKIVEARDGQDAIHQYIGGLESPNKNDTYTVLSDPAEWPAGVAEGQGPSVAEIKAHAENINTLFTWAAENGIEFCERIEGELRGRFDVKIKPHGVLDLYNMTISAKPDLMLRKAINNVSVPERNDYLDGINTLLLIAFATGNQPPAGELDGVD